MALEIGPWRHARIERSGFMEKAAAKVYKDGRQDKEEAMRFICLRRAALAIAGTAIAATAATQPTATKSPAAPSCSKLSVNGSNIVAGSTLTVTVNGATVSTHDQAASGELGPHMKPGPNRVGLSFAAPGEMGPFGTQAELRCLAPNVASSRNDILRLQPTRARLSAEVEVNYVPH